jgi:hypothetical protein
MVFMMSERRSLDRWARSFWKGLFSLGCFGMAGMSVAPAWAGRISPEVLREIHGSLLPYGKSPDDDWEFSGGGYVFRVDYDLTGDGRPELFVASSLGMYRGCPTWRLYHARKGGGYDPFLTKAEIREGWTAEKTLFSDFRFGLILGRSKGKPAIAIPWHDRFAEKEDEHWGQLIVRFVGGNVVDLSQKYLEEDWAGREFGGKEFQIEDHIKGVLVADLLRDPDTPWREIRLSDHAPSGDGYYLHPDDAERVKRLGAFTPTLAWKWFQLAQEGRTPSEEEKALEANAPEPPAADPEETDLPTGIAKLEHPIPAAPPAPLPEEPMKATRSFWMEVLQFSVRWRALLSGGASVLVAGWGVLRWRRHHG